MMLTRQQATLLRFIKRYSAEKGFCPSYREMLKELGLKSTNNAHRLVLGLEERGYIRRLAGHARAIEVMK